MSDRASLLKGIKQIIADVSQLGITADEVGDEPNVATRLGLQSTQILEITVELENEFGVEFDDTEITEELWNSVGSLADAIQQKQGG
ncbi:MAG: acyl carrier protein [Deltaproteobacteria bacterium]|nr:MAG: acyl carrier protein [Deltaproteobacteria bacterium]